MSTPDMSAASREGDGERVKMSAPELASRNGPPPVHAGAVQYCAQCGAEVNQAGVPERFGERFCSEAHAEEFIRGVRSARAQVAAIGAAEIQRTAPRRTAGETPPAQPAGPVKPSSWRMALKMAACCGVPMLALVVLAGGGGALLGAAGAVLPLLLLLACPLGMFFMMRGMAKRGQHDKDKGDGDGK